MRTGTIVDYGRNFIKILAGEELINLELNKFPDDARMGNIIEFEHDEKKYEVWREK
jgi:hypothetical protein